ncbi:MAG: DUF2277 domain-containing protein [Candidatus Limnocylindrales bacterium]|jgi:hypothetical protein
MCRSIHTLHNFEPPTTADEVRAAALQYVRKVSGMAKPSRVNQEAFDRAVEAIESSTQALLDSLVATAAPHDRGVEYQRARARWEQRQQRTATSA